MTFVTATLSNYRQSPRKVRLVSDYVKGKKVSDAIDQLSLLPRRASDPIKKLILSALANAKNMSLSEETLTVKNLTVNQGVTLMRRRSRARGRAYPIRKRTSHVVVTLETPDTISAEKKIAAPKEKKVVAEKAVAKKAPAKKTVKKEVAAKKSE